MRIGVDSHPAARIPPAAPSVPSRQPSWTSGSQTRPYGYGLRFRSPRRPSRPPPCVGLAPPPVIPSHLPHPVNPVNPVYRPITAPLSRSLPLPPPVGAGLRPALLRPAVPQPPPSVPSPPLCGTGAPAGHSVPFVPSRQSCKSCLPFYYFSVTSHYEITFVGNGSLNSASLRDGTFSSGISAIPRRSSISPSSSSVSPK